MLKKCDLFLSIERDGRIVLPEGGINEVGSDYSLLWKDKRTQFGYFKLYKMAVLTSSITWGQRKC